LGVGELGAETVVAGVAALASVGSVLVQAVNTPLSPAIRMNATLLLDTFSSYQPNQYHNFDHDHIAIPRKKTYPAGRQPIVTLLVPCIPGRIVPFVFGISTRA
jgi:hypothetical protein